MAAALRTFQEPTGSPHCFLSPPPKRPLLPCSKLFIQLRVAPGAPSPCTIPRQGSRVPTHQGYTHIFCSSRWA